MLLDVDGVLTDFHKVAIDEVNRVAKCSGVKFETFPSQFPEWNLKLGLQRLNAPVSIIESCLNHIASREFHASLTPIEDAVRGVSALRETSEVVAVTSPNYGNDLWITQRIRWLEEHFLFSQRDMVFTQRKELVSGHVFIDDNPENVLSWMNKNVASTAFLWDAPYNRNAVPSISRVNGWDQLTKFVRDSFDL